MVRVSTPKAASQQVCGFARKLRGQGIDDNEATRRCLVMVRRRPCLSLSVGEVVALVRKVYVAQNICRGDRLRYDEMALRTFVRRLFLDCEPKREALRRAHRMNHVAARNVSPLPAYTVEAIVDCVYDHGDCVYDHGDCPIAPLRCSEGRDLLEWMKTKSVKRDVVVYIDDGRKFTYTVENETKAREHAAAIVSSGYRHNDGEGECEHYGPHRVLKVAITGGPVSTSYPDRATGT